MVTATVMDMAMVTATVMDRSQTAKTKRRKRKSEVKRHEWTKKWS